MGQAIPTHLQGKSLRPVIEGHAPDLGDVFIEWNSGDDKGEGKVKLPKSIEGKITREQAAAAEREPVRTIVTTDGWKLNASSTLDENELYNLNEDPGETHNLAKDPRYQSKAKDLFARIRAWQEKMGDKLPLRGV
jgi:arylsulfatase A-like enzyme